MIPTFSVPARNGEQRYERAWQIGELLEMLNVYADVMSNRAANDEFAEFFRDKIRATVDDPQTARRCAPRLSDRRQTAVSGYRLLRHVQPAPCAAGGPAKAAPGNVTETGIDTADESFEFDAIVFATGFDAMTGAVAAVDIVGRDGVALKDKWSQGRRPTLG